MIEPMWMVFGILIGATLLFVWGRPRADIVAMLVVMALMLTGVLSPEESLAGFGDPVVVLVAAVFIVGEGLVNTGVAHRLGEAVQRAGGSSEARLIVLLMVLAVTVGAFMSSTAVVAMLIPVTLGIAQRTGLSPKRLLMPLSVASLISGMTTLIASPPNLIVDNALRERQLETFGFFDWMPFGLAVLVASVGFMLATRGLLGAPQVGRTRVRWRARVNDLIESYGLSERLFRLALLPGSPLVDRSVARAQLRQRYGVLILGFERRIHGRLEFLPALLVSVFEPGDTIYVLGEADRVAAMSKETALTALPPLGERLRQEALQEIGAAEIMLAPDSKLIGKSLAELEFRARYGVSVMAVRHRGKVVIDGLAAQTLDFGDSLLVGGSWNDIARMWENRENFVVLELPAEYQERLPARRRAPYALVILLGMIGAMALGVLPNTTIVLMAALAMVASGCVSVESIYRVISWRTVVLIAGMLPLATALSKTGATEAMGQAMVASLGSLGPLAILAAAFLATAAVGLFISNSATAVLIAPIAVETAQALHVSPQAFAMTVSIACSAAFVTPVSSPVNMLVMEPGGYRFVDFVKIGLPLTLLTLVATVALAALIYRL